MRAYAFLQFMQKMTAKSHGPEFEVSDFIPASNESTVPARAFDLAKVYKSEIVFLDLYTSRRDKRDVVKFFYLD